MTLDFSISGDIDPVALYAAILSTVIAIVGLYQWWARNRISVKCNGNMVMIPSVDDHRYISVTVTNTGVSATTITGLYFHYWESPWKRIFRSKAAQTYFAHKVKTPHVLPPGEQWQAQVPQDGGVDSSSDDFEGMASKGLLYAVVAHSMGGKNGVLCRVKIPSNS